MAKKGVIWIGGKSRRFKASTNNSETEGKRGSKAYALLNEKPLFQWAYETIATLVDEVQLSFNKKEQIEELTRYMKFYSGTSFVYKSLLDEISLPSKGPLLAQLTVLKKIGGSEQVITISVDMPFVQTKLFEEAIREEGDIVTFQSKSNILEPLVSVYRTEAIQLALQFISHFPFGRADDLIRGVEKVTLLTIPENYPSEKFPWNRNINSVAALEQLSEIIDFNNIEKDEIEFTSNRITNTGNNQERVLEILLHGTLAREIKLDSYSLEQSKAIYSSLKSNESFYYAGRFAEYIESVHLKGEPEKTLEWCKKAAISYFNEAKFWQKSQVPFIASHAFKDFEKCSAKYGKSIVNESERLALEMNIFNNLPGRK